MSQALYDLPEGWEWVELGDVATLLNGRAYKQHELLDEGKTPVLRVGNFFSNRSWYYSDLDLPEEKYCVEGDLLYAWSASFGPKIWTGQKAIYHYHIWKILTSEKISKWYLYHLLERETESIKASGNGVGMFHATKSGMEKKLIPLPPLAEQTRIVEKLDAVLSRIDTAIDELQQSLALVDAMFKSGLEGVFADLALLYNVTALSQVVKINSGIALPSIFKESHASGAIPFYKVAQMNNHPEIMTGSEILFSSEISKTHKVTIFPKGSVLIPKRGGAILTNKKRILVEDASYDSNIMGLKANNQLISDEYLFAFMQSIDLSDFVDASTIPQINNKHIDQMMIPVPSLSEQEKAVQHINELTNYTTQLKTELTAKIGMFNQLKASVLDGAFRGEV